MTARDKNQRWPILRLTFFSDRIDTTGTMSRSRERSEDGNWFKSAARCAVTTVVLWVAAAAGAAVLGIMVTVVAAAVAALAVVVCVVSLAVLVLVILLLKRYDPPAASDLSRSCRTVVENVCWEIGCAIKRHQKNRASSTRTLTAPEDPIAVNPDDQNGCYDVCVPLAYAPECRQRLVTAPGSGPKDAASRGDGEYVAIEL